MHLRIILAALVLGSLIASSAWTKAPSSAPLHTFYGEVKAIDLGSNKMRMFRLSVRPDGTVESATPYVSFGYEELDARAVKWLKRWRFHPNSVTEVRIPMASTRTRR